MSHNWRIVDVIYMHLHVAGLPWYTICIVLQIDQCILRDFKNAYTKFLDFQNL